MQQQMNSATVSGPDQSRMRSSLQLEEHDPNNFGTTPNANTEGGQEQIRSSLYDGANFNDDGNDNI